MIRAAFPHFYISLFVTLSISCCSLELGFGADPPLELRSVTRTPLTRAVSGNLVTVRALVLNRTDSVAKLRLSGKIDGFPGREHARNVEIAPRSECHYDLLIKVPLETRGTERIEVIVDAMQERGGTFYQLELDGKPMSQSLPLSLDQSPIFPAMIIDPFPPNQPFWHWPPLESFYPYEHIKATCIDSGISIRTANFDVYQLPTSYLSWEAIDWLVIGEPGTLQDDSTIETVKRYVQSGGILWIMLDQVPVEQVRPLLNGRQLVEEVDETDLSEFIVEVSSTAEVISEEDRTIRLKSPVKMKRVAVDGAEVTHKVGDWPAAFHMQSGYGRIYFTTVGSQAWIKERTGTRPHDLAMTSDFQNRLWSTKWAREVSSLRTFQPFSNIETTYAVELIGSPVPPRTVIVGLLSSFCLLMVVVGVWRYTTGDLSQIGFIAPAISIVVAIGILIGSAWIRREIKKTDSRLQIVEVSDDGNNAYVREHGAIYQDTVSDMKLVGQISGSASPAPSVTSGIKTLVADDMLSWSMHNTAWPPGIWRYSTAGLVEVDSMRASGRLTAKGLEILPPRGLELADAVVNFVPGNRMICSRNGDSFFTDGALKAAGDRWFVDTLVSNEQTRRAEVYRDFFLVRERETRMPRRLLGWSNRWNELPQWNRDDLERAGAALVSIPIQLIPPAQNQPIFVPHGLISIRSAKDSISLSTAFDSVRGEWISESTYATEVDLEFLLPHEVLPFIADQIDVELDIRAPRRTATVFHIASGNEKELGKVENPTVPWRFTIKDEQVLKDCSDGVLRLKLVVSDRKDVGSDTGSISLVSWQVSHFHLSFRGSVGADTGLSSEIEGAP